MWRLILNNWDRTFVFLMKTCNYSKVPLTYDSSSLIKKFELESYHTKFYLFHLLGQSKLTRWNCLDLQIVLKSETVQKIIFCMITKKLQKFRLIFRAKINLIWGFVILGIWIGEINTLTYKVNIFKSTNNRAKIYLTQILNIYQLQLHNGSIIYKKKKKTTKT